MSRFPDGVIGAWRGGELMRTALIGEIVFMSGLAAGRLRSLFLDGWPSLILIAYAVAELLLAGWGTYSGLRNLAMPILVALENLGDIPIGCLLCRAEARTICQPLALWGCLGSPERCDGLSLNGRESAECDWLPIVLGLHPALRPPLDQLRRDPGARSGGRGHFFAAEFECR